VDRQNGVYIKDLSMLGRDLATTIIVDNVMENFRRQSDNGIKIKSWYDDMSDNSLQELGEVLEEIVRRGYKDLRVGLRELIGGEYEEREVEE
jgi:CTD small phosphatase-like protein 2